MHPFETSKDFFAKDSVTPLSPDRSPSRTPHRFVDDPHEHVIDQLITLLGCIAVALAGKDQAAYWRGDRLVTELLATVPCFPERAAIEASQQMLHALASLYFFGSKSFRAKEAAR